MSYQYKDAKVRAWTKQIDSGSKKSAKNRGGGRKRREDRAALERIEHVMVFDTETTTDKEQRLKFGSALLLVIGVDGNFHAVKEYLFYADDLAEWDPEGYETLQDYVLRGRDNIRGKYAYLADKMTYGDRIRLGIGLPEEFNGLNFQECGIILSYPKNKYSSIVVPTAVRHARVERAGGDVDIELLPVSEFAQRLQDVAYPDDTWNHPDSRSGSKPATVVGFNLPFDISRIARGVVEARGWFTGGFSFEMREGLENKRVRSKKTGIKGHSFSYSGDSKSIREGRKLHDSFTDAATLAFGLTSESYNLKRVAEEFGASWTETFGTDQSELFGPLLKTEAEEHGLITHEYVDYCRADVRATAAAYVGLVKELDKHPIDVADDKVYSPASIAKGYFKAMGVQEPRVKKSTLPDSVMGFAMSTFYGGRAEAHIRKVPVPVEHVDITSMYPTVNILMGLWDLFTSEGVRARVETSGVQKLIDEITIDELFNPERWPEFRGIVQVQPDDDLLPLRACFGSDPQDTETIGISYVTSDQPMWWTIPDVINAKINGGKAPRILQAIRFYPDGEKLDTLRPVELRGQVRIDPSREDFFKAVIERRLAIKRERNCGGCNNCERCGSVQFLKILANAGSYGIFVEMNRQEDKTDSDETIFGGLFGSWDTKVNKPEQPGKYCFPPLGTLITGAARLVLGMLEKLVTDAGGTWAMCDTDSMAIVASENGGWIAPECSLPPRHAEADYPGAIPVLPYETVEEIRQRFDALNPYDAEKAGRVEILKRELPDNLSDPQVYCYAISAKRYAEFTLENGEIVFPKDDAGHDHVKEHGLGQYMNPEDPSKSEERGKREWIRDIWRYLILRDAGSEPKEPDWFSRTVMSQVKISTWSSYRAVRKWNEGKEYQHQIKPYGFMIAPVVDHEFQYADKIRPIGPFTTNPEEWETIGFRDLYDPEGPEFYIATDAPARGENESSRIVVKVKSYADVVGSYSVHPETKFADSDGKPCSFRTRGLLYRHHVKVHSWQHQGKETNDLQERETDTVVDRGSVVAEYGTGLDKDDFARFAVPVLRELFHGKSQRLADMVEAVGMSVTKRTLTNILSGKHSPRSELREALISVAVRQAIERFGGELPAPKWKNKGIARKEWREVLSAWADRLLV